MQAVSPAWSGAPPQITVNIALSIDVMIADHLMAPATVLSQGAPPAPGDGDPLPWSWHLRSSSGIKMEVSCVEKLKI